MNKRFSGFKKVALVAGSAVAVFGMSSAKAAVDVTAISAALPDIATAGAAIVGVVVAIAVIAWIRKVIH